MGGSRNPLVGETPISHMFGYFSHFWANFTMSGIKKYVLELRNSMVILSHTFMHPFTQFSRNFIHFWLLKPFLGQFQHVGYQKACTRAEKFIGDTGKALDLQNGLKA